MMFQEPGRDGNDLRNRLALTEDHLRESLAQGAVIIRPGETKIFVGKMAKMVQRSFGRHLAGTDLV